MEYCTICLKCISEELSHAVHGISCTCMKISYNDARVEIGSMLNVTYNNRGLQVHIKICPYIAEGY